MSVCNRHDCDCCVKPRLLREQQFARWFSSGARQAPGLSAEAKEHHPRDCPGRQCNCGVARARRNLE